MSVDSDETMAPSGMPAPGPAAAPEAVEPDAFVEAPLDERTDEPTATGSRFDEVVSGLFDTEQESAELQPLKRVLAPLAETPKLHKVLAQAGMG